MDPAGPPTNSETSINFDAQAQYDADEAEYRREEQERQAELKALLTDALDDLSDEDEDESDGSKNVSHFSHDVSRDVSVDQGHDDDDDDNEESVDSDVGPDDNQLLKSSNIVLGEDGQWQQVFGGQGGIPGAMTPSHPGSLPPNLARPVPHVPHLPLGVMDQQMYEQGDHNPESVPLSYPAVAQYQMYPHHQPYPTPGAQFGPQLPKGGVGGGGDFHGNTTYPPPGHGEIPRHPADFHMEERGEIEGANDEDGNYGNPAYHNVYHYQPHPADSDLPDYHGLPHQQQQPGVYPQQQMSTRDSYQAGRAPAPNLYHPVQEEDYKVQYLGQPPDGDIHDVNDVDLGVTSPRRDDYSDMQDLFLKQDAGGDQRQLSQLQILYRARGRKIEELTESLQKTQEESERDVRILKHRLNIVQDEHSGMSNSLSQCQTLLADSKQKENALGGQVSALQSEITVLKTAKEELVKKIQTAESTIESLNAQVHDLGSSESLLRAKEQHESLLGSMRQKYEAEIYELKEKLDQSGRGLEDKNEEIQSLKRQLSQQIKAGENQNIDRADTINRLTRSLEESQRQCQELLEAGTGHELSRMKVTLQEAIAGKSIAEDMSGAMQGEIQELKEQVMMYESASQYGVFPGLSSTASTHTTASAKKNTQDLDDSYAQLGIKPTQPQFETPESARSEAISQSADTVLHGLKAELERCLAMYKVKRQQVSTLQEELKTTKSELTDTSQKYQTLKKESHDDIEKLRKLEGELGDLSGLGPREMRLQKDVDKLTSERNHLSSQIEDLKVRIEELAASEERLNEINCELNEQMADMVKEYDEDKQIALQKCQEACLQHHESSKEQLRLDILETAQQENAAIVQEYEETLSKLRQDLSAVQEELLEVKSSYVNICNEKDVIEEKLEQEWSNKLEQQIDKMKGEMEEEKEAEIKQLRETIVASSDNNLTSAKEKWLKDKEEDFKRQMEAEVVKAKVDWFESHQTSKEQAIQNAVRGKETEWKHRYETQLDEELDHRLQKAKEQWQTERRIDIERELQSRLVKAKETWRTTELSEAVARASAENSAKKTQSDGSLAEGDPATEEREKFDKLLEKAKETWRKTELEEAVAKLKDEIKLNNQCAETQDDAKRSTPIQEQIDLLQKELVEICGEKERMETELSTITEQWAEEKSGLEAAWQRERDELTRARDTDKRQALSQVRDQCEKDYRQFLQEHQDTLNKALRSAREQFALEKADIIRKCEEEIAYLKSRDRRDTPDGKDNSVLATDTKQVATAAAAVNIDTKNHRVMETKPETNEGENSMEKLYEEKLASLSAAFEQEKAELCQTHRQNLCKALEEAKHHWEQKLVQSSGTPGVKHPLEDTWASERHQLLAQISERDHLLMAADSHMEAELSKLQKELGVAQQAQLEQRVNNLEAELTHKLNTSSSEKEELITRMEEMQAELFDLQAKFNAETDRLKSELKEKDSRISLLKKQLKEATSTISALQKQLKDVIENAQEVANQHAELTAQYSELTEQLGKAEQTRQDMVDMYKKSEKEHAQIVETYKQRQTAVNDRLKKSEHVAKTLQSNMQEQLTEMQESMEREHSAAVEALKRQNMELRNDKLVAVENLRKQHNTEMDQVNRKLEQAERGRSNTPTQTDGDVVDQLALQELREQYVKAVDKMRGDVMNHVSQSNTRAAESVRTEVVRERQKTGKRLRRYYKICVDQILGDDFDEETKASKMAAVEQFLDNIPEKDSTCSRATTPGVSTGTKTPTPDDLVTPRDQVRGDHVGRAELEVTPGSRSAAAPQREVTPRTVDFSEYRSHHGARSSSRASKSAASDAGWENTPPERNAKPSSSASSSASRPGKGQTSRSNRHSTPQLAGSSARDPQYSGSSIGSSSAQQAARHKRGVYMTTPREGSPVTTPELTPTDREMRRSGSVTPTPDTPGFVTDINQSVHNDLSTSLYFNSTVNDTSPADLSNLELSRTVPDLTYTPYAKTSPPSHPHVTGRTPSRSSLTPAKDDSELYVNSLNARHVSARARDRSVDAVGRYSGAQADLASQAHLCRSEDVLDTSSSQDRGYKYTSLRQRLANLEATHSARSSLENQPLSMQHSSMVSMPNLNISAEVPDSLLKYRAEKMDSAPKSAFSSTGYISGHTTNIGGHKPYLRQGRVDTASSFGYLATVDDKNAAQSGDRGDSQEKRDSGTYTNSGYHSQTNSSNRSSAASERSGRSHAVASGRSSATAPSRHFDKSDTSSKQQQVNFKVDDQGRSSVTRTSRRMPTPGAVASSNQVFRPVPSSHDVTSGPALSSKRLNIRNDSGGSLSGDPLPKPIPMVTRTTQVPSPAVHAIAPKKKAVRYAKH